MSEYIMDMGTSTYKSNDGLVYAPIEQLREEVVRCRDCKEFTFGSDEYATVDWCDYWGAYVESLDGFCAWGEMRQA